MGYKPRKSGPTRAATGPRAAAREAIRDAILEGAEQVFARRGFGGARMADVARASKMAIGTLYNYFQNKDQVFRSLLTLRGAQFVTEVAGAAAARSDPKERLELLVQTTLEYMENHRATYAAFVEVGGISESSIRSIGGKDTERHYQEYLGICERAVSDAMAAGAIKSGLPAAELVAFLTGAINGLTRAWIVGGGTTGLAGRAPVVISLFLHGANAQK